MTNNIIKNNATSLLQFKLGITIRAMVVGDNILTTTKNAGELLAILIVMQMRRYDAGHIAQWSTSRA